MIQTSAAELEILARDAVTEIAGLDVVEQIEVQTVVDLDDRPPYHFTLLVNWERAEQGIGIGLLGARLRQRLREELEALGDEHRPLTRTLDRTDWEKRGSARLY